MKSPEFGFWGRLDRREALLPSAGFGRFPAAAAPRPFDGAQDRLAIRPVSRTLGCVRLPFLGLNQYFNGSGMAEK